MPGAHSIALGVYVRGHPTYREALDRYVGLAGRPPALVHLFRNWTDVTAEFDPILADEMSRPSATLMISWQPPAGGIEAIASGEQDAYVRAYARAVRAWGEPLLLRFAHEMNGDWIPWLTSGAAYCVAWRRVHRLFAEEGTTDVQWVWCPHVTDARARPFEPWYPGHDVVDWVGLDGYNWGRSQRGTRWRSFDAIFADSYGDIRALAPGKPVMLAEVGCAEEGGDKATWIRDAFLDAIPARYVGLQAVVWFNAYPRGHANWRVDSSPAALEAWREVVTHGLYGGSVP
jgi:beta-mannanase